MGGDPDIIPLTPYRDLVCKHCGIVDYDEVFKVGFKKARNIRGKGDFLCSNDNFWCFRQNVVDLFEREGVQGVQFKQIADTEWHVINITKRIRVSADTFRTTSRKMCPVCSRLMDTASNLDRLSYFLEVPPKRSVFSTVDYLQRCDRDVLMDKSILNLLVKAKVTGGCANLLPSDADLARTMEARKRGEDMSWQVLL